MGPEAIRRVLVLIVDQDDRRPHLLDNRLVQGHERSRHQNAVHPPFVRPTAPLASCLRIRMTFCMVDRIIVRPRHHSTPLTISATIGLAMVITTTAIMSVRLVARLHPTAFDRYPDCWAI